MKITIHGENGEGKSTVGLLIEKTLRENGFSDVILDDEDLEPSFYTEDAQRNRLRNIAKNPIRIKTVCSRVS